MNKSEIQGGLYVAFGAICYGILTTLVKLGNFAGFSTFELTFSQYLLGFIGIVLLEFLFRKKQKQKYNKRASAKNIRNLLLTGCSLGLTSLIYYFSVQFISVSVAIVLLMQSVWIGVVLDAIFNKIRPGKKKIVAVVMVLIGTVLAANLVINTAKLDWRGFVLGFLAAISYSITIFASSRIALDLPAITRSKWMTMSALVIVGIISAPFLVSNFHPDVLYKWGIILGILGVVLPPLMLTSGMPKVNLGIGAIITSLELPVAVLMGYFVLNEQVTYYQWGGVVLILIAVVVMNLRRVRRAR